MARKGEHNGQTLGKQAAGIRVVRDDGRPIRLGFAVVREVGLKSCSATCILGIGWMHRLAVAARRDGEPRAARPDRQDARGHHEPRAAPQSRRLRARRAARPHARAADRPPRGRRAPHPGGDRRGRPARGAALHRGLAGGQLAGAVSSSARRCGRSCSTRRSSETPVASVEQRLAQVGELGKTELAMALREQLAVQRRMQAQLAALRRRDRADGGRAGHRPRPTSQHVSASGDDAQTRSGWPSASAPCATRSARSPRASARHTARTRRVTSDRVGVDERGRRRGGATCTATPS